MELAGATIVQVPLLLSEAAVREFNAMLHNAVSDANRSVVLKGGPEGFCRGLDFSEFQTGAREIASNVEAFAACLEMIRLCPKPTVAFVEGETIGGGVGLAAACDGVLATSNSTFALTELLFKIAPAVILPYLALRILPQKLKWMALTAEPWSAERAMNIGLVDVCCEASQSRAILKSLIRNLNRLDPEAVEAWKRMTERIPSPGTRDGIQWTALRLQDGKIQETFLKFIETGIPPWTF
jgi:enoyl-CoA hydratase/carnithine racemase